MSAKLRRLVQAHIDRPIPSKTVQSQVYIPELWFARTYELALLIV